jgi:hypothetical protein
MNTGRRLEELEGRWLLDGSLRIVGRQLTVTCDSQPNSVTVDQADSTTTSNGQGFAGASFDSIRINSAVGTTDWDPSTETSNDI